MARYYLSPRAAHRDSPDTLRAAMQQLKDLGATNVRSARQFGWENQPKVATFDATPEVAEAIRGSNLSDWYFVTSHWRK